MSIARNCPYSDDKENCKYEIYDCQPRLNKCSTCERFLKKNFPNIDTSKFNIDENGNVLRDKRMSKEKIFKGFPLDEKGCVQGAYPYISVRSELQEAIIEKEHQYILNFCTNMNIDPNVLAKQKAEIERLCMENERLKKLLKIYQKRVVYSGFCQRCKHIDETTPCNECNVDNYLWELAE